jgi:hypothetical protein
VTDDVNVSYSFQIGGGPGPNQGVAVGSAAAPGAAAAPRSDQRAFAYADCEQVTINERTVMIINLRKRKKMVVTRDVGNALTHCTSFATLSEHTASLCASLPLLRGQQRDVLQVLEAARDAGILASSEEAAERLNRAPDDLHVAPTRVFIITCDRPAAVERLLDSMLAACTLTRHDQLFLIDDSRHASNALRNEQFVAAFNLRSAKSMHYVGAAAASRLLAQLEEALPAQSRGLRFLLDRGRWAYQPTYGLSRNLALLLSVGYRAIVLDDDILCRAVRPPSAQSGIAFSNDETREAWFYASTPDLLRRIAWCDFDPLARQAEALGNPVAVVLSRLHGGPLAPAALAQCQGNLLGVLDGASPVLVTQCGSAGDPGTSGGRWVVKLGDASVERLLSSSTDRATVPESRSCWLGHTRPTISLRGDMSQMTGLDNSRLLPPYVPVMRGEDDLFASMAAFLHPRAAVFHCDWAVPHLPIDDRAARNFSKPFAPQIGLGTLSRYLRGKIDTRTHFSVESRLAALAAEIRALGECSPDTLLAQCDVELANDSASLLASAQSRLAAAGALHHPGWEAFLQQTAAQAQAALAPDVAAASSVVPQWMATAQEAAIELSEALASWSLIRDHSALITAAMITAGDLQPSPAQ